MPDFPLLLACLFLMGTFVGGIDVGGNIVIVWLFREKFAPFLTGLHFIWGLGALAAPLIIVTFEDLTGDLRLSYTIIAGILLVMLLLFIRLPSPAPIRDRKETRYHIPPRPMFMLIAMMFLAATSEIVVATWLLAYVLQRDLADAITGGYLNSSLFLGMLGARLASIFLLRRFTNCAGSLRRPVRPCRRLPVGLGHAGVAGGDLDCSHPGRCGICPPHSRLP